MHGRWLLQLLVMRPWTGSERRGSRSWGWCKVLRRVVVVLGRVIVVVVVVVVVVVATLITLVPA